MIDNYYLINSVFTSLSNKIAFALVYISIRFLLIGLHCVFYCLDFEALSSDTIGEHLRDKDVFFCTLGC